MGVYEPLKRKLLTVFPDHLSSVAHLVRLGTVQMSVSTFYFPGTCCQILVFFRFNE